MMKKTTASALLLLSGMACIAFPLKSEASTGRTNFVSTSAKPTDSLVFKQALEAIQNRIPLTYNQQVQRFIDSYTTTHKARFSKMLGLAKYYFPIYEKVFEERNVPEELKFLSIVESSLNPHAVSRVGATGPWQFMYDTGKMYGLKIDSWVDERKDPVLASHAAASYLLDSYFVYDDWLLAIASYNCGRNNIKWAMQKAGGKKDYWSIQPYLPAETRNYIPAFIATMYVMNNYWKHNINPQEPDFAVETHVLPVSGTVSLSKLAQAANTSVEELKVLNPAFKKLVVNGTEKQPRNVVLPANSTISYASLYEVLNGPGTYKAPQVIHASYTGKKAIKQITHKVKQGESLLSIANKYLVEVQDIKAWNNLRSAVVVPGQELLINTSSQNLNQREENKISYTVRPGDTLSSIAKKFKGATEEEIRVINNLEHSSLVKPGMILKIIGG